MMNYQKITKFINNWRNSIFDKFDGRGLCSRRFLHVLISKERHDELIFAEISDFASKQTSPLTLREIQQHRIKAEASRFLHQEIPIRFAARVKQLESLPSFEEEELLFTVRNIYVESFKQLRNSNSENLEDFVKVLKSLKKRHTNIVPMVVTGARKLMTKYPDQISENYVNQFLNAFFLSRIGTEMLTSNFLSSNGIIDPSCDPLLVLEVAVKDAERLCEHHYGRHPKVLIWNFGNHQFPYVPQYLYYIIFELLKNAMRASIEAVKVYQTASYSSCHMADIKQSDLANCSAGTSNVTHLDNPSSASIATRSVKYPFYESACKAASHGIPSIHVVVSGDDQEVAIKLSDYGGGISSTSMSKIWSYTYTTARPVMHHLPHQRGESGTVSTAAAQIGSLDTKDPSSNKASCGVMSPLAGFGCGLPLSRLYASYLGGHLQIVSMPSLGTDSYLHLNRLGHVQELLPSEKSHNPSDTSLSKT